MIRSMDSLVVMTGFDKKLNLPNETSLHLVYSHSGKQTMEIFKQHDVSILVTFWNLTDMPDGEFVRRIRRSHPWLPVVVLVDEMGGKSELDARALGVVSVLLVETEAALLQKLLIDITANK